MNYVTSAHQVGCEARESPGPAVPELPTQGRHAGREALRASVEPVWAAEGAATLHLTLNPVVEPGPSGDQATVRSVLLIVDLAPPPAILAAAAITQELRRAEGSWRITRRTVAPASSH
jgi:SnoaL-like domain